MEYSIYMSCSKSILFFLKFNVQNRFCHGGKRGKEENQWLMILMIDRWNANKSGCATINQALLGRQPKLYHFICFRVLEFFNFIVLTFWELRQFPWLTLRYYTLEEFLQILQLLIGDFTELVFQLGELQLQRRDSNGLEFSPVTTTTFKSYRV